MNVPEWLPFVRKTPPPSKPFSERAARWADGLSYRDVPRSIRRTARAQLTSSIGAALRTRTHPIGDRIGDTLASSGDSATVLGGGRADPATAACGNAALVSALDFDGSVLGGQTGPSCVFVPLAYAEAAEADGEELLVAQIAANEIVGRLGAAVPTGPFSREGAVWIHAAGAAVGRAVIEGDDPDTLADALVTALSTPTAPIERSAVGSDAGIRGASAPIRAGLAAVESARAGIGGRRDLIESEGGLLSGLTRRPVREFLFGLGERWHTDALSVKSTPGSVYVAAATEAAFEARGRFDHGRTAIRGVDVYGPHALCSQESTARPYLEEDRVPIPAALRAVPRATAEALVEGTITPQRIGTRTEEGAIRRVADRVDLKHDPELTVTALRSSVPAGVEFDGGRRTIAPHVARAVGLRTTLGHLPTVLGTARRLSDVLDPSEIERRIGARVVVRTADGRAFEASVERPPGVVGAPLAEVRAVARRKCREALEALGVSEPEARSRTDRLLSIDEVTRLRIDRLTDGA